MTAKGHEGVSGVLGQKSTPHNRLSTPRDVLSTTLLNQSLRFGEVPRRGWSSGTRIQGGLPHSLMLLQLGANTPPSKEKQKNCRTMVGRVMKSAKSSPSLTLTSGVGTCVDRARRLLSTPAY